MTIRPLTSDDAAAVAAMFDGLSEQDVTLIREDLSDRAGLDADWPGRRWIDVDDDGTVLGYAALIPLPGWSSHVGELRLVVDGQARGRGIGAGLVKEALRTGIAEGRTKIVVELPTDAEGAVVLFNRLGFTGEALMRDHLRTRDGELRDLLIMAHHVADGLDAMSLTGVAEELV